jgi:hypothetical protein
MRAALVLCVLCVAPWASAQTESTVLAQSLFEQARVLMAEGRYAEACPKLEESQRLDPGGGTLLNLASCHEKIGRTASAWAEYNEAASVARRDGRTDREEEARSRVEALEPRLCRVLIQVSSPTPPDVEILLDGQRLPAAAWGTAVPADPGKHELIVRAPGYDPFTTPFELATEGKTETVNVPVLAKSAEEPAAPPVIQPAPMVTPPLERDFPAPEKQSGPPTSALVSFGVGLVGFGFGTYFGLRALDSKDKSDATCKGDVCDTPGYDHNEDAKRDAWISNAGFGIGLIATGIGAYLWLSDEPSPSATSPRFGFAMRRGGGTLGMNGTF